MITCYLHFQVCRSRAFFLVPRNILVGRFHLEWKNSEFEKSETQRRLHFLQFAPRPDGASAHARSFRHRFARKSFWVNSICYATQLLLLDTVDCMLSSRVLVPLVFSPSILLMRNCEPIPASNRNAQQLSIPIEGVGCILVPVQGTGGGTNAQDRTNLTFQDAQTCP